MGKTEKQLRAWLHTKLNNYLWKIQNRNSYGSMKKLKTISKDLHEILDEFDKEGGIA